MCVCVLYLVQGELVLAQGGQCDLVAPHQGELAGPTGIQVAWHGGSWGSRTNIRSTNIRITNIRLTHIRLTNIRITNIRLTNIKLTNIRLTNIRLTNIRLTEIR